MTSKQSSEAPHVQITEQITEFDQDNLQKIAHDLETDGFLHDIPKRFLDIMEKVGTNIHTNLADIEVARIAYEYLHTEETNEGESTPLVHYCVDTGDFAVWNPVSRRWSFGKRAQEKALIGKFVTYLRDISAYWADRRKQTTSEGKVLFDPQKTPFGRLGTRYLSNRGLNALVESFKIPPEHHKYSGQFDNLREKFLINDTQGRSLTVDLRTATIAPTRYDEMLSITSKFTVKDGGKRVMEMVNTPPQEWLHNSELYKVIEYVFGKNTERMDYANRVVGKWMVAGNLDQTFDIFVGNPRSGKGVLLDSLVSLMGDYAHILNSRVLTEKGGNSSQDGYELGHLAGKRLVVASETRSGEVLNDQLIKSFTGGKFVTIRKISQDIVTTERTFNIVMDTNHLPLDMDRSGGQETRLNRLCGVGATIPREKRRLDLIDHITTNEQEIFLAWCMMGAREYLTGGLRMIEEANGANALVKLQMSNLRDFIDQYIEYGEECVGEFMENSYIKGLYEEWCEENGKQGKYKKNLPNIKADLIRLCSAREGKTNVKGKSVRGLFNIRRKKEND